MSKAQTCRTWTPLGNRVLMVILILATQAAVRTVNAEDSSVQHLSRRATAG